MVVVEGVARSLNPNTNIWTAAKPVVEAWMKDNLGPKAIAKDLRDAALVLARYAPRLPGIAEKFVIAADRPTEPPAPRLSKAWPYAVATLAGGAAGGAAATLLIWGLYMA
jgi:ubiquinone biosynthesis protein